MLNRPLRYVIIGTALLASSCIFAIQNGTAWRKPGFTLSPDTPVLISDIADGSGADGVMPGSGDLVAAKVTQQLMARGLRVVAGGSSDKSQLLAEAAQKQVPYVLIARVTRWENNATEWSSRRDSAGVAIELVDVISGEVVVSGDRLTQGVSHPDRCADILATNLVKGIFGEPIPKANPQC